MDTLNITREDLSDFNALLEDTVEYFCQQMAEEGRLVSGQTVYALMECFAVAKSAEFEGLLLPDETD